MVLLYKHKIIRKLIRLSNKYKLSKINIIRILNIFNKDLNLINLSSQQQHNNIQQSNNVLHHHKN